MNHSAVHANLEPTEPPLESWGHNVIAHFYRGEMQRMTVWRARLDQTTNWALVLTTALATFTLGQPQAPHYLLLVGLTLNTMILLLEGRRYQHLHHSKWRLLLLERHYYAPFFQNEASQRITFWGRVLGKDLEEPQFTISLFWGTVLRLRRNHLMIHYFTVMVWLIKIVIHPTTATSVGEVYQRLSLGHLVPNWFVAVTVVAFLLTATVLAWISPSEIGLERWSQRKHEQRLGALADQP